jgi:hypothetical protein
MNKPRRMLIDAIKDVAIEDAMEASRDDVLRDLAASGMSLDDLQAMRASVRANAACLLSASRATHAPTSHTFEGPSIRSIRTQVQVVLGARSITSCTNLHIQSEEQLRKLYADLVTHGLIKPEDGNDL